MEHHYNFNVANNFSTGGNAGHPNSLDHDHSHNLTSDKHIESKSVFDGHSHDNGHNNIRTDCCDDDICCSDHGCCDSNPKSVGNHDHNHSRIPNTGCCDINSCGDYHGCCNSPIQSHAHGDHDHGHDHGRDHGHDHGHNNIRTDCCDDDICCSDHGCCDSNPKSVGNHDHNHSRIPNTGCCDINSCGDYHGCCNSPIQSHAHGDHDHGHDHGHIYSTALVPASPSNCSDTNIYVSLPIAVEVCSACDPESKTPHAITTTRFRIANLCCAGEERIIRSSLEGRPGIEKVMVNIVGRYAVVKHCPVQCCSPVDSIIEILNAQRLGASIQEAILADDFLQEPAFDAHKLLHISSLMAMLITGIITGNISYLSPLISLVIFVVGTGAGIVPLLLNAGTAIMRQSLDINILMIIAIIGAIACGEYFDSCLLVTLFMMAEFVEDTIMRRVRKLVNSSVSRGSKNVTLLNGTSVKIEDLVIGDKYSVRAGEMVCADGIIVKGECVVNESAVTGESMPVSKKKSHKVLSGTILQNGYAEVEVTINAKDGTMQQLQQTVNDMQADKGNYDKMIDEFSKYWTPTVLLGAFILVVAGGAATNDWVGYVNKGLVLLVLTCPCAIVIAAPIPSVCTIAIAAKHGVLIKGSSIIEKMGSITSLSVDKTGTLTKGFFKVGEMIEFTTSRIDNYYDPLQLAAAIEAKSTHPLANAVVSAFCGCIAEMEGDLNPVKKIQIMDGVGISGWVEVDTDWKFVAVGNERLLSSHGGKVTVSPANKTKLDNFMARNSASCIVVVVIDDCLELALALSDEIREESSEFVARVTSQGLSIAMLTGDHDSVAIEVANTLGITDCKSRLLPHEKLEWIQNQQNIRGKYVMMIGDGINDATALSVAHVGVAMGEGGAAMAVEAADLVIMSDNLLRIPSTLQLCCKSKAIIVQNCVFAVGIKLVAVVLAALGMLEFWQAILIDLGSLVVVILNGVRPMLSRDYNNSNLDTVQRLKSITSLANV